MRSAKPGEVVPLLHHIPTQFYLANSIDASYAPLCRVKLTYSPENHLVEICVK